MYLMDSFFYREENFVYDGSYFHYLSAMEAFEDAKTDEEKMLAIEAMRMVANGGYRRLHLHVPCSRGDLPDFYCNACRKTVRKFYPLVPWLNHYNKGYSLAFALLLLGLSTHLVTSGKNYCYDYAGPEARRPYLHGRLYGLENRYSRLITFRYEDFAR